MLNDELKNVIVDHALQNDDNLKVSLSVGSCYNAIREAVVIEFGKKLEGVVVEQMEKEKFVSDWGLLKNYLKSEPLGQYSGFYIYNLKWKNIFGIEDNDSESWLAIGFEPGKPNLSEYYYGIRKPSGKKFSWEENLYAKISEEFNRRGKVSTKWLWWDHFDNKEYRSFSDNLIVRMNDRKEREILAMEFANYLIRIAKIADQIVA